MKTISCCLFFIFSSCVLCAQKDSLRLSCPLVNIIIKDPNVNVPFQYDQRDKKLLISSSTDTSLLSPVDGKIYSVSMGEERKYEIVMYYGDYYIWITGVAKPLVKPKDKVKKGQSIATIKPNDEIEFLLFKEDEPVDPRKYLDCKGQ